MVLNGCFKFGKESKKKKEDNEKRDREKYKNISNKDLIGKVNI